MTLPDLFGMSGLDPLPVGEYVSLHSNHVLMDDFHFDSFDQNAFYTTGWRSWTVEDFAARKM